MNSRQVGQRETHYLKCTRCGRVYAFQPGVVTTPAVMFSLEEETALRLAGWISLIEPCLDCYRDDRGYQGKRGGSWRVESVT